MMTEHISDVLYLTATLPAAVRIQLLAQPIIRNHLQPHGRMQMQVSLPALHSLLAEELSLLKAPMM